MFPRDILQSESRRVGFLTVLQENGIAFLSLLFTVCYSTFLVDAFLSNLYKQVCCGITIERNGSLYAGPAEKIFSP